MKPVLLWSWPEGQGSPEAQIHPHPTVHAHGGKLPLKTHSMEDLNLDAGARGGFTLGFTLFPLPAVTSPRQACALPKFQPDDSNSRLLLTPQEAV